MKARIFGVLLLMVVMAIPAFAAYDIYLAIDGVAGTPSDATHKDWIPVSEIQDNLIKPAGTVSLVISKPIDANSGILYRGCLLAMPRSRASLDVCKDGTLMYRITIEDLTITQIKPQFTKKDAEPREEISFGFRSITWEFYSADGKTVTPRTGWNNEMKKAI